MEKFEKSETREPVLSAEERAPIRDTVHDIENKFSSLSWDAKLLTRWLRRYHKVDVDLHQREDGNFFIMVDSLPYTVPTLPAGYGFKGGAARAIFENALRLPISPPRDLDIVYVGDVDKEDSDLSNRLMEEYAPYDMENGHEIEHLQEDYFTSRDFTLNELLYVEPNIIFTKTCILDTMRNIVRFSEYEKKESWTGEAFFIKPKLMAKALRLVATTKVEGQRRARLTDEIEGLKELYIDEFHMSLHLDRAIGQSLAIAQEYVNGLVERGFLPKNINSVQDAYQYLVNETDFVFRCVPSKEVKDEINFWEDNEEDWGLYR